MLYKVLSLAKKHINSFIQQRFDRWLRNRMPGAQRHLLSNRNIFIFPSKFGFCYLIFVLLLFLLGTNYQNNVVILLSYLLVSFFLTCMLHSFFNFSGMKIEGPSEVTGYAEDDVLIPLTFVSKQQRHHLVATINDYTASVLLSTDQKSKLSVSFNANSRGVYNLPRVKISSEYAFGLFTTWTRLDFNCRCIIYPAPIKLNSFKQKNNAVEALAMENGAVRPGIEDFAELKQYQKGEPLTRVAWKQMARGQGQLTKHYQEGASDTLWLDIKQMPAASVEEKLGMLCYLTLEYTHSGEVFGLNLGINNIAPSSGAEHMNACLTALAKFNNTNAVA